MSKPRYGWWGYVRYIVRMYPERKNESDALHQQSITASLSGMPPSGKVSRGTEDIATRSLPKTKQKEYDAVFKAIEATKKMQNGDLRLRIIDLVYWKQSHTVEGAAMQVGYSTDRGKQLHGDFIRLVAKNYGLLDYEINEKKDRKSTRLG